MPARRSRSSVSCSALGSSTCAAARSGCEGTRSRFGTAVSTTTSSSGRPCSRSYVLASSCVGPEPEPGRGVRLRIEVDQQHGRSGLGDARRHVDRRGGLADAALLIGKGVDARRSWRDGSTPADAWRPFRGAAGTDRASAPAWRARPGGGRRGLDRAFARPRRRRCAAAGRPRRRSVAARSRARRARRGGPAAGTARPRPAAAPAPARAARSKRSRPAPRANCSERSATTAADSPELRRTVARRNAALRPAGLEQRHRHAGDDAPAGCRATPPPEPTSTAAGRRQTARSSGTRRQRVLDMDAPTAGAGSRTDVIDTGAAASRSAVALAAPAAGCFTFYTSSDRPPGRRPRTGWARRPRWTSSRPAISCTLVWTILRSTDVIGSSATGSPVRARPACGPLRRRSWSVRSRRFRYPSASTTTSHRIRSRPVHDRVRQVLDGVDGLAVLADQQPQIRAVNGRRDDASPPRRMSTSPSMPMRRSRSARAARGRARRPRESSGRAPVPACGAARPPERAGSGGERALPARAPARTRRRAVRARPRRRPRTRPRRDRASDTAAPARAAPPSEPRRRSRRWPRPGQPLGPLIAAAAGRARPATWRPLPGRRGCRRLLAACRPCRRPLVVAARCAASPPCSATLAALAGRGKWWPIVRLTMPCCPIVHRLVVIQ